jgi:hypothetical protein
MSYELRYLSLSNMISVSIVEAHTRAVPQQQHEAWYMLPCHLVLFETVCNSMDDRASFWAALATTAMHPKRISLRWSGKSSVCGGSFHNW